MGAVDAEAPLASAERERFLREHVGEVYAELTDGYREAVRVEELVARAGERYPDLMPGSAAVAEEAGRMLSEKRGLALDQGLLLSRVLASERPGRHLVHAMMRPRPEALAAFDAFRRTGRADRRGSSGGARSATSSSPTCDSSTPRTTPPPPPWRWPWTWSCSIPRSRSG
jgi:hypothetical protein